MVRKVSLIVFVLCLLVAGMTPVLTHAQGRLAVLSSSTEAQFPLRLQFNLSAAGDANITDIRLRYTIDRAHFAQVTSEAYIEFVPATRVDVSWALEMVRVGGLPSGANIDYWWVLGDAAGAYMETEPVRVQFNDTRYPWQSFTEGMVTLRWYEGDQSFVRELMASAQQGLARLEKDTGAYPEKPVVVYIYASAQDLLGAMIYPQEWTGGVAFTGYGIIAIGIPLDQLDWGRGAIAHELAHLITNQMTSNPYSGIPVWLDEGLAMYAEGASGAQYRDLLANSTLIPIRSLASPFSAYPDRAYLSYAESYSVVEFLITTYGQSRMLELLNTFQKGSTYDGALKKVYGFDMDGLNTLWQSHIKTPAVPVAEKGMPPALVGVLAGLATVLLLILSLFVERLAWRRGW